LGHGEVDIISTGLVVAMGGVLGGGVLGAIVETPGVSSGGELEMAAVKGKGLVRECFGHL